MAASRLKAARSRESKSACSAEAQRVLLIIRGPLVMDQSGSCPSKSPQATGRSISAQPKPLGYGLDGE